ncbi:HigA family addiction module antidote protein [Caldithrix abyssi]|nr:HigA family addiction module antidote protein [Caldithrix abyssi]
MYKGGLNDTFGLSTRKVAKYSNVAPFTINRLLNGERNLFPEMALRLSHVFGRGPESWLTTQENYSLWQAKQKLDLTGMKKLDLVATG